jgi:hypothetical protein
MLSPDHVSPTIGSTVIDVTSGGPGRIDARLPAALLSARYSDCGP